MANRRSEIDRLLAADLRFSAFLTALACGWRDSNGQTMPEREGLGDRLRSEVETMSKALDRAKKECEL